MRSEAFAGKVRIATAGITRFYSEGYTCWSRENLEKLFSPDWALESEEVQGLLDEWERHGMIRRVGDDHCYIEVLPDFAAS